MKCHVDICRLQLEQDMRERPRLTESYVLPLRNEKLDIHVARFFLANNTPFRTADHEEFHKLLHILRPGYKPLSRKDISDKIIDKVHDSLQDDCWTKLCNSTVSMALDGWSNIHNEPIVCATITTAEGEVYITDTIDTSGVT